MVLKYYYDLMSQPCRALYIFLNINKVPFESVQIALRKGEHFTEEYEKINPAKKVPVIDHNGFKLTESIGILRYISREFEIPDHWYPKNSQSQAKIDEFLEWQHLTLRASGSLLFIHKVIRPMIFKQPVNIEKVDHYRGELEKNLDIMEKMFLIRTPFLNSQQISISDLVGACEIEQPIATGHDVVAERPILKAWLDRVKSETQPHYDEAHIFLGRLKAKVSNSKI